MSMPYEIDTDALLPENKAYSVVRIDLMKPPGHEDCAVKLYEVDDLSEAVAPERTEIMWMAYDSEGVSTDLPVSEDEA